MPFPLAHPAAVLPFRRYCSRWLNFPALVIGSLVPDLGYLFPPIRDLSHELFGSILFGLPVAGLILVAFYVFRRPVVERMPAALRRSVLPASQCPPGPVWVTLVSLVIGIWSHVLWDSVTHKDGWFIEQFPVLLTPVFEFDGRTARLCNVLWYVSSLFGAGWLFLAFEKWKQDAMSAAGLTAASGKNTLQDAIFVAILVVPISLIHHLVRSPIGFVMTAVFSLFLGILFIVKMGVRRSQNPVH